MLFQAPRKLPYLMLCFVWTWPDRLPDKDVITLSSRLLLNVTLLKTSKKSSAKLPCTDFENELKTVSSSNTVLRKATSFQTANKTQ